MDYDPVYYRIYRSHRNNEFCVVHMQSFDECDYDQERFLNETKYTTEAEAEAALEQAKENAAYLTGLSPEQVAAIKILLRGISE